VAKGGNEKDKGGREMQMEQQEARTFMIQEICEHIATNYATAATIGFQ